MNFYDVLAAKNRDGGIPTINFFDLLFAQSMGGAEQWQTYEGTLPATLNANGDDMRQYQIYGNVGGVGDRTENLFDYTQLVDGYTYDSNGQMILNPDEGNRWRYAAIPLIQVTPGATYLRTRNLTPIGNTVNYYDSEKNFIAQATPGTGVPFTVPNNCYFITYVVNTDSDTKKYMLTEGSTAPASYEPYGYKLDMVSIDDTKIPEISTIVQGGWSAAAGTIPIPAQPAQSNRCRSTKFYPINGTKLIYNCGNIAMNIVWIAASGVSLGGSGFLTGAGIIDVKEQAKKITFIFAAANTTSAITPSDVIESSPTVLPSITTPIYIGNDPLEKDEYVDYQVGKVYRRTENLWNPKNVTDIIPQPNTPSTTRKGQQIMGLEGVYYFAFESQQYFQIYYARFKNGVRTDTSANNIGQPSQIDMEDNDEIRIWIATSDSWDGVYNITFTHGSTAPSTYIPYLQPEDPPVPLPALPTCEGTTVIDYAGQSVAPEKVVFEYKKGGN